MSPVNEGDALAIQYYDNEPRWARGRFLIGPQQLGKRRCWKRARVLSRIFGSVNARGSRRRSREREAAAARTRLHQRQRRRRWWLSSIRAGESLGDAVDDPPAVERGNGAATRHEDVNSPISITWSRRALYRSRRSLTTTLTDHCPMRKRGEIRGEKKRRRMSDSEDIWKSSDALPVSARGGLKNLTDASPTIETIRTDTRPAVHWSPR